MKTLDRVRKFGEVKTENRLVKDMVNIIKNEVLDRFDHRNLNLDCVEFENLIPTAENILIVIYKLIRSKLDSKYKLTLKMWETEKNIFEYSDPK